MLAYIFPGQGSQYVGMGSALIKEHRIAKETFEQANDILEFDLTSLMLKGDMSVLTRTENAQPALLTLSVAAFRVLQNELSITPNFLLGHSLGEYSALCCGGVLNFNDSLRIVRKRGLLMQEAVNNGNGTMMAVSNVSNTVVDSICKEVSTIEKPVTIACFNGPNQVVISGDLQSVRTVEARLSSEGAVLSSLKVSASFHSLMMKEAADKLEEFLIDFTFNDSTIPIISNVNAKPYQTNVKEYITLLKRQMVEPVRWEESIRFIHQAGAKHAIELGSKSVLTNLMSHITNDISSISFENPESFTKAKAIVSRYSPPAFLGKCLAIAVATKNRNWNEEEYHSGVIVPYQRIKSLAEIIEKDNRVLTKEEMVMGIEMLDSVFHTKKIIKEERDNRINELLRVTKTEQMLQEYIV
ncbi:ACP S-malonyltransferase [Paenibacillus taichungensis]|uniref:ACP S-malonyltransferase n=1 Tax=Paenibacillus taichungensis TaxID=484184 RepID=UPI0038D078DB